MSSEFSWHSDLESFTPCGYIKFSLWYSESKQYKDCVCWAKTTKDDLLDEEELIQPLFSDSAHLCTAA